LRSSGASPIHVTGPQPATAHLDGAGGRAAGAVDGLQDLRAARADEPGQAEDLPGPDGEGHPVEAAGQPEVLDLQQRGDRRVGQLAARREDVLDGAAGHQRDHLAGGGAGRRQPGGDGAAVLEHGDPVADLTDLLQPVGDVDDGDAAGGEVADDGEEVVDLLAVQDRGGLVHDDQPGVLGQRAGHADHLLRRGRQRPDLGGGPDLGVPEPGEQRGGGAVGLGRAGDPQVGALAAEEDVVGDGEPGDQVQLLVDGRDAQRHGRLGVAEGDRGAVPGDLALVGLVRAGQDLDQRRLAGAVLAEQAVHLTGADVEVHAVEGADARELLDDAVHRQQRCCRVHWASS
jgi:hypothetical protein